MEADGRLDGWCSDNLKWLRETYGERNLVSAVLHMDEKTPHTRHYRTDSARGAQESQKGRTEREKRNTARRTRRMYGCVLMTSWQGTS